jgi:hypothetical protein
MIMRNILQRKHILFKLPVLVAYGVAVFLLSTDHGASQGPGFSAGDTIPGFVLRAPSGSIADLRGNGTYDAEGRQWTVILSRALVTGRPDEDVQLGDLATGQTYLFSVAVLDNSIGRMENMLPQDQTPYKLGVGPMPNADLVAVRVEQAPAGASDFTGPILQTKGGEVGGVRAPQIALQAAYDDTNIYMLARWPDETESISKQQWVFDGTTWMRTSRDVNDEDRLAIWFNINAEGFEMMGCASMCHSERMQTRNADGHADLWAWKSARTNPLNLASDEKAAPIRADDSGTSSAIANEREGESLPIFMAEDDPGANARFLIMLPEGAKRSVPFPR